MGGQLEGTRTERVLMLTLPAPPARALALALPSRLADFATLKAFVPAALLEASSLVMRRSISSAPTLSRFENESGDYKKLSARRALLSHRLDTYVIFLEQFSSDARFYAKEPDFVSFAEDSGTERGNEKIIVR